MVRDYDPAWPDDFAKLAMNLKTALAGLNITVEHIGSTAVPGLAAKPIIDLDVILASPADLPEAIRRLEIVGYTHAPSTVLIVYCVLNGVTYESEWLDAMELVKQANVHQAFREIFLVDTSSASFSGTFYGNP